MRSNVIRLVSVLLGALPATWLAQSAVLVVWVALDNNSPIGRTLGMLWGVSGVLGAIGAWLIIFDVGSRAKITRRLVIFLVSAGIAAASVLMIGTFEQLFSSSSPDRIFMLCVASAIGVGVFQICRVSRASSWVILGWVAAGYVIGIGFVVGEPLYTNVVNTERLVIWECWDPGCDDIMYTTGGTSYQMEASNDLVAHLRDQKTNEVPAKLRVQTRFGRFESFTIVELAGFPIEGGSARNRNQPSPPSPQKASTMMREVTAHNIAFEPAALQEPDRARNVCFWPFADFSFRPIADTATASALAGRRAGLRPTNPPAGIDPVSTRAT